MNKPNPLVPQGTFADKGRSHVRLTVFAILAVHLVLLGVLLIAGCNKGGGESGTDPNALVPPTLPPPVPTDVVPPPALTPTNPPIPGQGTPALGTGPGAAPTFVEPPPTTTSTPPPPPPAATEQTEHTIVQGESFYTLGKKYNVGFKAIEAANPGVDSTKLKIGQKVKIPASKAPSPTAGIPTEGGATNPAGETVHVVKSGDNLWTLSRKYEVKESAIRSANQLKTSQLKVGQKLKIPSKTPAPAATHPPPPADHGLPPGAPPPGGGLPLQPQ